MTSNQSVVEIARQVRKLVVQEWLSNEENYHHLVDGNLNYTVEAKHSLAPGYFAATIGDAMPLASAKKSQEAGGHYDSVIQDPRPGHNRGNNQTVVVASIARVRPK